MDHFAVRKAYPNITVTDDSFVDYGLDASGNKVSIVQSKVDEARATLDAEYAALEYSRNRAAAYPFVGDQLDLLWHAIDADTDFKSKFSAFYNSIKEVKDANPKP